MAKDAKKPEQSKDKVEKAGAPATEAKVKGPAAEAKAAAGAAAAPAAPAAPVVPATAADVLSEGEAIKKVVKAKHREGAKDDEPENQRRVPAVKHAPRRRQSESRRNNGGDSEHNETRRQSK